MPSLTVPSILANLIGRLGAAMPARARVTFLELLIGAAATKGGHGTDTILASGSARAWTTYYWFLEYARWSWLHVWQVLPGALTAMFAPAVWHVIVDDTVVERISTRAPGSLVPHNHHAKPNRPPFLRGQGWLCLAAVVERGWKVGAVPLMLRLVRRGTNRGKLKSARFLLHLLGQRLAQVRVLLDAWFMRGWLITRTVDDGHTVIGCAPRSRALQSAPATPARVPRTAAQIRCKAHAGQGRGAADTAQRWDPLWQTGRRALAQLPGRGALPERPGGAGGVGGTGAPRAW
jgi:hypothetical protein